MWQAEDDCSVNVNNKILKYYIQRNLLTGITLLGGKWLRIGHARFGG